MIRINVKKVFVDMWEDNYNFNIGENSYFKNNLAAIQSMLYKEAQAEVFQAWLESEGTSIAVGITDGEPMTPKVLQNPRSSFGHMVRAKLAAMGR